MMNLNPLSLNYIVYGLLLSGISSLLSSINFLITVLNSLINRLLGMSSLYISLFVYSIIFTAIMLVLTLPILTGALIMLLFDLNYNVVFFDPIYSGDPVFFQHLFWYFGHQSGCPFKTLLYAGTSLEICTLALKKILYCHSIKRIKSTGKVTDIGQSAGKTLNKVSSETTCKDINFHRPKHNYPKNDDFGYYLAGLIDGDGYISRMQDQPNITISFQIKDISLAYYIKKTIGYGTVSKIPGKNACKYVLTNHEGLKIVCLLISDRLRIDRKILRLKDLKTKLNLDIQNKNILDLTKTYYLAGLIDSDGSLAIKAMLRSNKKREVRLLLRFSLIDENIILDLYNTFGGYKSTRISNGTTSYNWSSTSHKNMKIILNYLDRYQLCSKKYLEYILVRKTYLLIQNKQHLTDQGFNLIQSMLEIMSNLKINV